MKNTLLILLLLIFPLQGLLAQSTRKVQYPRPSNFQKKVTHLIAEKSRTYYSLNTEKPSSITVRGPGILRVMTRGRFVPEEGETIKYEIVYTIDGAEQKRIKMNGITRSKKATYLKGSLGVPGRLEDFEIRLGRGYHTIELWLKDRKIPVAARYKFTPTKEKKQEWIAYSPLQPAEMVDLISKEKIVHYCRFSSDKPLKIEVNGPTQLRVLTRIENHYQMKGRIHYRLQVKENNKVINTYQLSSRRSEVAVYKSNNELIPGKACEFVINVPKGRHSYEVLPLDQDKSTLLGRLLLPLKDIKLEK
jgi:hypothetical protein